MAVEGVGRGNTGGDDPPVEQTPSMSKAVFPSSLGLSFCVPLDVKALKVTPRWGRYQKAPDRLPGQPQDRDAQAGLEMQACGCSHEIPLKAGPVGPLIADDSFPDAQVKGLIRRRSDHWSVTLFLVNEGVEPPPPNRERTWMFQCELAVEAPDGSPIFHKRSHDRTDRHRRRLTGKRPRLLAMLYRRHVEFAVGHGIGVHVDVDPTDPNRPPGPTRVVPSYEIPKTTPPTARDAGSTRPSPSWRAGPRHEAAGRGQPEASSARSSSRCSTPTRTGSTGRKSEDRRPRRGPGHFRPVGQQAIARCRATLEADRGRAGLAGERRPGGPTRSSS